MFIKNLSIGKKLGLLSGMIFTSLLFISLVSYLTIGGLSAAQKNLGSTQLPAIRAITITDMYHDAIGGAVYKSLVVTDSKNEDEKTETRADAEDAFSGLKENFGKLSSLEISDKAKNSLAEISPLIDKYVSTAKELTNAALAGQREKAQSLMPRFHQDFAVLREKLDGLADLIEADVETHVSEANAMAAMATPKLLVVLFVSLVCALVATILFARSLLRPMGEMTQIAKQLAIGNIEQTISFESKDEIGMLADSFRSSIAFTRDMASAIEAISLGKLDFIKLTPKSEKDLLTQSVNKVSQSLKDLNGETQNLIKLARAGDLSRRGDTAKFQGEYAGLIGGFNQLLDAVSEPIHEASGCLKKVAQRDLTVQMKGAYQGEFAQIKESLNTALANLDEGMAQISEGAEQVAEAATQISSGSQHLAQSSSEQASTLEEVAGNLQEISSMTRQNAANSLEARTLAENARRVAEEGKNNMERLNAAVDKIRESSDSTVRIIKTIEEIAFQTNLLALNAAVEAARAGDAGKGFAVVAEEVRNLAMRSAEAAKNTAQLIDESVKNTLNGAEIHSIVAQNLTDILAQIEKVSFVSAEIAAATEQQTEGIVQINAAFEQMNMVTQQTAANSEESASSAEELSGQSKEMLNLISSFSISRKISESPRNANFFGAANNTLAQKAQKPKKQRALSVSKPEYDDFIPFGDNNEAVLTEF